MSRGTELVKNSIIIMVGKIATQFVSFLLLPLFTSILTTSQYGLVDLFTTYVQLLLPIVTLLIEQGAFRYLLEFSNDIEKQKEIVTSSLSLLCFLAIIYSIVFVVISPLIESDYRFFLIVMLVVSAFSSWGLQIARGMNKMTIYVIGSFVTTGIAIALNVIFIAVLSMEVTGMLLATIISNFLCFIYVMSKLKIFRLLNISLINKNSLREMLRYSLPLIPNQLSLSIINFSDRVIVNLILGTAANGILAIAHKFSSLYSTFFGMFQLSWHQTGVLHFYDEDRDSFFTDMFTKIYRFFSSVCIGMIAIIPLVFPVLVQEKFSGAYEIIPIYLIAVLCNIIVGLLGVVYVALKRTAEIAKSTIFSSIINILVNIVLIRRLGLYATAIACFLSYFCIAIYRMVDVKKYLQIKYEYCSYIVSVLVIMLVTGIYYSRNLYLNVLAILVAIIYALIMNKEILFMCKNKLLRQ